jgi:hypothetical protein
MPSMNQPRIKSVDLKFQYNLEPNVYLLSAATKHGLLTFASSEHMKHGFKLWTLGHVAPIFRGYQIFIRSFTAGQELFSRAFFLQEFSRAFVASM